jgi:prepilin-type N-terminal cleavage/methylation domain-containing protein
MSTKKGFTLIELLIVLALIAVLAAILIVIIRPGEIFRRARDTQRASDLSSLADATGAYLTEQAVNPGLLWPTRGSCTSTVFFSTTTSVFPAGWPTATTATGTPSVAVNGTGWVPLNFASVTILALSALPVDPQNGQLIGGVMKVYSFSCDTDLSYEFAAHPENPAAAGAANDGGNQPNFLEVGSKKTLYP